MCAQHPASAIRRQYRVRVDRMIPGLELQGEHLTPVTEASSCGGVADTLSALAEPPPLPPPPSGLNRRQRHKKSQYNWGAAVDR